MKQNRKTMNSRPITIKPYILYFQSIAHMVTLIKMNKWNFNNIFRHLPYAIRHIYIIHNFQIRYLRPYTQSHCEHWPVLVRNIVIIQERQKKKQNHIQILNEFKWKPIQWWLISFKFVLIMRSNYNEFLIIIYHPVGMHSQKAKYFNRRRTKR